MIYRFSPLLLVLVSALPVAAVEQGQLDASETLFTVLAAANAAGYDAGLATSPPLRQQVREKISESHAAVIEELKAWYREHPEKDKTQDLSRFISLGISVGNPPLFDWAKREVEIPPDAKTMNQFRELLPRFYAEAKIAELWQRSQPAVDATLQRYQEPIAKAVLEANSYLRNSTSGYLGRRFQIFVDFLGAPNQVQTRSYGDDFFIVLTPSAEPRIFDIRHAYFRYLVDPLSIKYGMELKEKSALEDIAQSAPLLRDPYRSSFDLLATECLIKAIESRLLSNPSLIDQALREGFILTPFFAEQMTVYERQPDSMRLFFPTMVRSLSVKHETKRLENFEFAKEIPERAAPRSVAPSPPERAASVAAQTVAKADQFYYEKKDLENARVLYERALEQPGSAADHSRAYYGLAHVALLQNKPETADQLFRKTLESAPSPDLKAWSFYYLGKLSAISDEREQAAKWFEQALAVEGATPKAIESSRRELTQLGPQGKN